MFGHGAQNPRLRNQSQSEMRKAEPFHPIRVRKETETFCLTLV